MKKLKKIASVANDVMITLGVGTGNVAGTCMVVVQLIEWWKSQSLIKVLLFNLFGLIHYFLRR